MMETNVSPRTFFLFLFIYVWMESFSSSSSYAYCTTIPKNRSTVANFISSRTSTRAATKKLSISSPSTRRNKTKKISRNPNRPYKISLHATTVDDDSEKKKKKQHYQFGDFTKGLINQVTGKSDYQLGDLSRWVDTKVKDKITDWTGKEDYEFGDLSRWIDAKVKEKANEFTGKDPKNYKEYEVGDVTKKILQLATSRNYDMSELLFLFKVLVSLGVGLSPVATILPTKLLIDALNYSLYSDISERVVGAISLEMDRRMKQAIVGDPNYQVGDLTKRAILRLIDKDQYEFGDITKTVFERLGKTRKIHEKITNSSQLEIDRRDG